MAKGTRIKVSSGDRDGVNPYMIPECYIQIASDRLNAPFLSQAYKRLLEKQIRDCQKEIDKKAKINLL